MLWWEGLQVPVWRGVRLVEAVVGQETQRWPFEARCHDDHVRVNELLVAGPSLWYTLGTSVHQNTLVLEAYNVATNPIRLAFTKLVHNIRVDHRGIHEDALVCRCNGFQVTVEELAEEELGDEGEHGLLAPDVEAEEGVDEDVARNDPLVGAREDGNLRGAVFGGEFEGFHGRGATTDDGQFLVFGVFAADKSASL